MSAKVTDEHRRLGRALLDEVLTGGHSHDGADEVAAQAIADAELRGAEQPIVMRAEPMTVEPVLFNPVPDLDAVLLAEGGREVILAGTPDELREVAAGIVALVDEEATS